MRNLRKRKESGVALYATLAVAAVLVGLSTAMLTVSSGNRSEYAAADDNLERLYLAEAGVAGAVMSLHQGGSGVLGTANAPIALGSGSYWTTCANNGDGTFTVVSRGIRAGSSRALRAVVRSADGVFDHSVFAGNSSGDPAYNMRFGGSGSQADQIGGDIYSGRNVIRTGSAVVSGTMRATGTITGGTGETGVHQPIPDIQSMNYETNNDVNVAASFAGGTATYTSDTAGGSAWQLPENNKSHIFRLNPSDRTTETSATAKNDYFLEDPYETVRADSTSTGSDAYAITMTGTPGELGPSSNNQVFFIDGNLWIHNYQTMSLKFVNSSSAGTQVTFVVKGNIYISDNIYLTNPSVDGVSFIAMKDQSVSDSGNVYFGDPSFGTLERMQAFLYAENNFYDTNLSSSGSARVVVDGIMSAGNQVAINRDYGAQHSKLTVNYDQRVSDGDLSIPGMPEGSGGPAVVYTVAAMSEVSAQ